MAKASLKSVLQGSVFANSSGGIAIMMGLLLIPLIGAVGLSMDSARGYAVKQRLQESVDAAALAAAKDMTMSVADRKKIAEDYFNANWQDGYLFTKTVDLDVEATESDGSVAISAEVEMPTTLMRVLGEEKAIVSARSKAAQGASLLEVAIALDNTMSMSRTLPGGDRRIDAVKVGAKDLIDVLVEGSDESTLNISLIPFSMVVNVGRDNTAFLRNPSLTVENAKRWAFPSSVNVANKERWKGCVFERAGKWEMPRPVDQATARVASVAYLGNDVTDAPPSVEPFDAYHIPHPEFTWNFRCNADYTNNGATAFYTKEAMQEAVDNPSYTDAAAQKYKVRKACWNPPAATPTPTPSVTPTPSSTPTPTPSATPTLTPTPAVTPPPRGYDGASLQDRWKPFTTESLQATKVAFKSMDVGSAVRRDGMNESIIKVGNGVTNNNPTWTYTEDVAYARIRVDHTDASPDTFNAGAYQDIGQMIPLRAGYHLDDLTPDECVCPTGSDKDIRNQNAGVNYFTLGQYAFFKDSEERWFQQSNTRPDLLYTMRGGAGGRWILPWPADTAQEAVIGGWSNSGCGLPIIPLTNNLDSITDQIDRMDAPAQRTDGAQLGYEGTLINQGLVWAWRTLSPRWRGLWSGGSASLPSDYSPDNSKAIVILTDGLNFLQEPADLTASEGDSSGRPAYTSRFDWWFAAQPNYYSRDKEAYIHMGWPRTSFTKSNGDAMTYTWVWNSASAVAGAPAVANAAKEMTDPVAIRWGWPVRSHSSAQFQRRYNTDLRTNYSDTTWQPYSSGLNIDYDQTNFDLDSSAYGATYLCRLRTTDGSNACAYTKKRSIGGVQYPEYYLDLEQRLITTCNNIRANGVYIYFILFAVDSHPYKERAVSKFKECVGNAGGYYEAADRDTLREAFKDIGGKIVRLRLTQ